MTASLRAQLAEAKEQLDRWSESWERLGIGDDTEPPIENLHMTPGKVEIRMRPTRAFHVICGALVRFLDEQGAKNCVEACVSLETRMFTVEVRRLIGKSMAQLRTEAQNERDEARRQSGRLRTALREAVDEIDMLKPPARVRARAATLSFIAEEPPC